MYKFIQHTFGVKIKQILTYHNVKIRSVFVISFVTVLNNDYMKQLYEVKL